MINEYAVDGCLPDLTFLLKIDPKVGKGRIRFEDQDRLEQEKLEFHQRVYQGYAALEAASERIIGINAERGIEEISRDIILETERYLRERGIENDL